MMVIIIKGIENARMIASWTSVLSTWTMAMAMMMGDITMILKPMTTTVWTISTSFVVLVIKDAVPMRS